MPTRIADVVQQYQIETGQNSSHDRDRFINMAISGLKELGYDVTSEPVYTQLSLDSNNTSAVPTGLINVIGMYMNVEGVGLVSIVESDHLAPNIVNNQGEIVQTEKANISDGEYGDWPYYENPGAWFQGGQFVGQQYSGVDPNPYKFLHNKSTDRFEFSSNVQNPILEYMGEVGTVKGVHLVPDMAVDAIIHWIRYCSVRNKYTVSPREKDYYKKDWLAAKNLVLRRMANVRPSEMRQAYRSSYSLTTK
jgi:hypothetical protein